jgi:hypothetical protein
MMRLNMARSLAQKLCFLLRFWQVLSKITY